MYERERERERERETVKDFVHVLEQRKKKKKNPQSNFCSYQLNRPVC